MVPFPQTALFHTVTLVLCVLNSVTCPLTIVGNVLVFTAVLRKPQLRNVANTSILCLAFTDLTVGVFVQPSYVIYQTSKLTTAPTDFPCGYFGWSSAVTPKFRSSCRTTIPHPLMNLLYKRTQILEKPRLPRQWRLWLELCSCASHRPSVLPLSTRLAWHRVTFYIT